MDAIKGLRVTVDEGKHLLRGPDPRQSLVENLWIRNSNFAMVRWINTRDRPPFQERQTKASRPRESGSPRIVNLDKASIFTICQANHQHNLQQKSGAQQGWNENSAQWERSRPTVMIFPSGCS